MPAELVARLRVSPWYLPESSFVAVVGDEIAGFVMLSRLEVDVPGPDTAPSLFEHPAVLAGPATFEALNLSPLAVAPAHQGRGIGRALVEHAVAAANETDTPFVILEGDPAHYRRYGFEPASTARLYPPSPLIPDAAFMFLPLRGFDPRRHAGLVRYPDPFMELNAFGPPLHGRVEAVSSDDDHRFSKVVRAEIELLTGVGVAGDAHAGTTVRHRSRVRRDATLPNLRQVHLVHAELFDELVAAGHVVTAGDIGENVLTRGLPLLDLPVGTRLGLGEQAVVELTGLRNPCHQLDQFQPGLQKAVLDRADDGTLVRKAGVMAVVVAGGVVRAGDAIEVTLPAAPHTALLPV
ncbi:MAG TPA: GNAT family N-acetyltransferase [Egicoccus sp.]|nr:GNAT family N-acetyltransferase [Egicoccus sp.]HSK22080.1 GNAT family N-acetyltransferase [Egicoccus sp.]